MRSDQQREPGSGQGVDGTLRSTGVWTDALIDDDGPFLFELRRPRGVDGRGDLDQSCCGDELQCSKPVSCRVAERCRPRPTPARCRRIPPMRRRTDPVPTGRARRSVRAPRSVGPTHRCEPGPQREVSRSSIAPTTPTTEQPETINAPHSPSTATTCARPSTPPDDRNGDMLAQPWRPPAARLPIILDCDPGHDDAIAMVVAARHTNLLGITTVAGNAPLESTTHNAIVLRDLLGIDVEVHAGPIDRSSPRRVTPATCTARAGSTAPTCQRRPALRQVAMPWPSSSTPSVAMTASGSFPPAR